MTMHGPDGRPIKPMYWRYVRGEWDKRTGLVDAHEDAVAMALAQESDGVTWHRSKWLGRAWYRVYWCSRFRLADFWKSLNMDQRLMICATITSTILSIIALVVSILAYLKD